LPLFFTVIIGYLGFQVGFRRREEFMGILTRNRKDKRKDNVEIEPETKSGVQVKILDTSVIIDGRIADVFKRIFSKELLSFLNLYLENYNILQTHQMH